MHPNRRVATIRPGSPESHSLGRALDGKVGTEQVLRIGSVLGAQYS